MAIAFPPEIPYSTLKERHPEWKGDYWRRCRALYAGGPSLLEDEEILKSVMPKHNAEEADVYKERLSRAFYIPYPGSIIDKIVSELTGKPVVAERAPISEEVFVNGSKITEGETDLPPYYSDFFSDCSKPGGRKTSVNLLAREQILTALQCQFAWTLVDMPKAPEEGFANLRAQEKAGALKAYACPIAPENVIDWECDESGELTFALIQEISCKRKSLLDKRDLVTLRWRYYTDTQWAVYELEYDKKKMIKGPTDAMKAKLVEKGSHSFKRVPVRRLKLSDGLWAMGKLEAMARAHLNQRNALSWGQLKALFPVPILYAAPPNPLDPVSEDAGRTQQRTGPGYLWVLSEKDKMEYFSPDTATYDAAAVDLDRIRDEMHRVLHHMAMSVDNSGAALGRSAESKAIDQVAASVILRALGQIVREHLEDIYETVASGRGEAIAFAFKGMDSFDDSTVTQIIADAMTLAGIDIPSATFQKKAKIKVVKAWLGSDATPDEIEEISEELEEAITQDTFAMAGQADLMSHEARAAAADREVKGIPPPGKDPGKGKGFPSGKSKTKPKPGAKPKAKTKKVPKRK